MLSRRRFVQGSAIGAAASLYAHTTPQASAVEKPRSVAPFSEAVEISGSPRERGRMYGRRFRDGIHEFLEREIFARFENQPNARDAMLGYSGACMKVIQAECPEIAEELEGVAEGSGRKLEEHVLMTLHEELTHMGVLPKVPHCTAVAASPPLTVGGATFVGQTWDWMPSVAGMSQMLHWKRDKGPDLLAYAFPGLWVGAGLNSSGLALCWTSAGNFAAKETPAVGLPSYVILTHLMYQESLDAVREFAQKKSHAGWFTFVMGDSAGRLMNIEGRPGEVEVEETTGRIIRVGFGSRRLSGAKANEPVPRHARCVKMDEQFDQAAGKVDLATFQESFSNPDRGICVGKNTIDLMVYNTRDRVAYLSRGTEYGLAWREYSLAKA